jgi:hypothetical protein
VFDVSKHFKLGLGAFTDISPTRDLISFGDRQVDFFGFNVGLLFSNVDSNPDAAPTSADEGKTPIALAIGIRYLHGRGDTLGLVFPTAYEPDPVDVQRVATKINDIDINFGVKVLF